MQFLVAWAEDMLNIVDFYNDFNNNFQKLPLFLKSKLTNVTKVSYTKYLLYKIFH